MKRGVKSVPFVGVVYSTSLIFLVVNVFQMIHIDQIKREIQGEYASKLKLQRGRRNDALEYHGSGKSEFYVAPKFDGSIFNVSGDRFNLKKNIWKILKKWKIYGFNKNKIHQKNLEKTSGVGALN